MVKQTLQWEGSITAYIGAHIQYGLRNSLWPLQGTTVFEPLPDDTGALYHYQTQLVETCGPGVPDLEELDSYGCVFTRKYILAFFCYIIFLL